MMQNYRNCAGVILFNDSGKVLMCARADQKGFQWQFPQGGIENEESVQDAAARELFEETSLKSVKFLLALSSPISYVYPRIIHKAMAKEGRNYVGQRMYWTLAYFYGNDDEIKFDQPNPEFKAYEWVDVLRAYKRLVFFKRSAYRFGCKTFEPYIQAYLNRDKCFEFDEKDFLPEELR